jgi:squalene-hopene/tetraprenyl-beta-curcumene cyclase
MVTAIISLCISMAASSQGPALALQDATAPSAAAAPAAAAPPSATPAPPLPVVSRIAERADQVPCSPERFAQAREAITKGLAYLRSAQSPTGAWMLREPAAGTDQRIPSQATATAVTALCVKAFAQAGAGPASDPIARRAVEFIRVRMRGPEGKLEPDPSANGVGNYVASAVVSALAACDQPEDALLIQESVEWLRTTQWDEGESVPREKDWYGGSGYGSRGRPDLSNTQMMLDALHDARVSPDDPAVQRAMLFVTRTQNLTSTNPAEWAQKGSNDGGFVYTPANNGESFASEDAGEGRYGELIPQGQPRSLRSYGSMTYAGLKSLLYAGLSRDDPRVKAALEWIRMHWTFDQNPGLGKQGWLYYLHAQSRALNATRLAQITDSSGTAHNWRDELIDTLVRAQRPDGSWRNDVTRWEESRPELASAYALLALEEAIKPVAGTD